MQLGATYRDMITGFEGVAIGHCEYITGCSQTLIQPTIKDGTRDFVESRWFDEQRLKRLNVPLIDLDNGTTPGFDKPTPRI